jgi:hypothetical protein
VRRVADVILPRRTANLKQFGDLLESDQRNSSMFDDLTPRLISIYEEKITLCQRLIDISSEALVDVPKPNVDYDKLAAEVTKLRAQMDNADRGLFYAVPLVTG